MDWMFLNSLNKQEQSQDHMLVYFEVEYDLEIMWQHSISWSGHVSICFTGSITHNSNLIKNIPEYRAERDSHPRPHCLHQTSPWCSRPAGWVHHATQGPSTAS